MPSRNASNTAPAQLSRLTSVPSNCIPPIRTPGTLGSRFPHLRQAPFCRDRPVVANSLGYQVQTSWKSPFGDEIRAFEAALHESTDRRCPAQTEPHPLEGPVRQPLIRFPRILHNPEGMDNQALFEVLEALDGALSHIPYAVGGSAALAVWGRALPRPVHVTVFCPPYSKENIRFWAAVHGMFVYPDRPDTIGVRTSDGRTRSVRIKFVAGTTDRHGRQAVESLPVVDGKMARHSQNSQPHDSANDATDDGAGTLFAQRFKTVRIAHARRALVWSTGADAPVAMSTIPTTARVLTLSCLLNMLAYEYVRADQIAQRPKQGDSRGRTGGADTVSFEGRPGKAPASWALFKLASDILWVLHRILEGGFVDEGAMPLSWGEVPHVADARFWDVFTMRHEGADKLFEEAGLFRRESCDDNDQWSTIVEFDLPANALSEEQQSLNELR